MEKICAKDFIFSKLFRNFDLTLKITTLGMLASVAMLTKFIAIDIGEMKLSLFYIPCFIAGAFFGPVGGLVVGFVGETLGSFLRYGSPMLWVVVGNSLMGAIIGLAFLIPKLKPTVKIIIGSVIVLVVVTMGLNSYALWAVMANKVKYLVYLTTVRIWQPLVLAINVALFIFIYKGIKVYFDLKNS